MMRSFRRKFLLFVILFVAARDDHTQRALAEQDRDRDRNPDRYMEGVCKKHHRQTNEVVSLHGRALIGGGGGATSLRKKRCREYYNKISNSSHANMTSAAAAAISISHHVCVAILPAVLIFVLCPFFPL
ncbi:hypothetical protein D8674_014738 [Pyrus ussuriensis x Pyrus communis]|uniref:Uncharacterized protein n=1 Tax=Pyrus ussuriensis x Pyrus communis TaxID=2448454 RepID=A0A5N5FNJ2_9ROSA|nr:hypothetical protein D8674_040287 [Pyrus ussuriensis x Pyrus communis]KAB2618869.1 hypothetical protein D8674_014738 [Pyrus ussuriensis x Pyrus communis]